MKYGEGLFYNEVWKATGWLAKASLSKDLYRDDDRR